MASNNVTVYAENLAGHVGFSETAIFTIPKPKPFSKTMIIAFFTSVAFWDLSRVAYLKKRKN